MSLVMSRYLLTVVGIKYTKQWLRVDSIYCIPRYILKKDECWKIIMDLGERFIKGENLNAKHIDIGVRVTEPKRSRLRRALSETEIDYLSISKPTYWPTCINKIPFLLDFYITWKILPNLKKENYDLCSDYSVCL